MQFSPLIGDTDYKVNVTKFNQFLEPSSIFYTWEPSKITKIASCLWKSLRVNTIEGAILFIYAPCCSKVHEKFGMGIGLESLLCC